MIIDDSRLGRKTADVELRLRRGVRLRWD